MPNTSTEDDFVLPAERWPPYGFVLPLSYRFAAQRIQNLPVKPDDVWIVTFSKSGTNWMSEAVWLLVNKLDFDRARKLSGGERVPFLESPLLMAKSMTELNSIQFDGVLQKIEKLSGRRVVATHLPWPMLPQKLRDPKTTTKIVYVARQPKDVCISFFHFNKLILQSSILEKLSPNLETYADRFLNDQVIFTPYWTHVIEFWKRRNYPNIFFVFFEEMKQDLPGVIKRLADFLESPRPSEEDMANLTQHLSFDSMKQNPAVNKSDMFNISAKHAEGTTFIREGKVNQWKEKMTPELIRKFDNWIKKNTEGTDFKFYNDGPSRP